MCRHPWRPLPSRCRASLSASLLLQPTDHLSGSSQVKTRIQLEPEVYNKGFIGGFRQVIQKEGAGALLTGLGPTAAGYFLQGAFKFVCRGPTASCSCR